MWGFFRKNALNAVIILCQFVAPAFAETNVYFSPRGGCEANIVSLIQKSQSKIDAAIYSLNNVSIISALEDANARGVKIRVLLDRTQAAVNREKTKDLMRNGIDLRLHSVGKIQHNKFAIFDNRQIVTGSFNWTQPAENVNEENCLITDDPSVVRIYENRFTWHLWAINSERKSKKYFLKIKKKQQPLEKM